MKCIRKLFSISKTMVHSIVYTWANMLCVAFTKKFSMPTWSQLLWAYPKSVMKNGEAKAIHMVSANGRNCKAVIKANAETENSKPREI